MIAWLNARWTEYPSTRHRPRSKNIAPPELGLTKQQIAVPAACIRGKRDTATPKPARHWLPRRRITALLSGASHTMMLEQSD
jgi:hypothetical protein